MGVGWILVNHSRRELVQFAHVPASTEGEILAHPPACSIVTAYLLACRGDRIALVSDTLDDWPFPSGGREDLKSYCEVTRDVIDLLIETGHVVEHGRIEYFPEHPGDAFDFDLQLPEVPQGTIAPLLMDDLRARYEERRSGGGSRPASS